MAHMHLIMEPNDMSMMDGGCGLYSVMGINEVADEFDLLRVY